MDNLKFFDDLWQILKSDLTILHNTSIPPYSSKGQKSLLNTRAGEGAKLGD